MPAHACRQECRSTNSLFGLDPAPMLFPCVSAFGQASKAVRSVAVCLAGYLCASLRAMLNNFLSALQDQKS